MTNPFAALDHIPFAGFGVKLAYGWRPDGSIVSVADVAFGLACDCICPVCEQRLVARKTENVAHNFAHHRPETGCGAGRETNAHIWAKLTLEAAKHIQRARKAAFNHRLPEA